jgi:ABC-type branched-subunit amino acid transport system permease subunit/ABC-type branched-subunit amino acid transport system ATPase component
MHQAIEIAIGGLLQGSVFALVAIGIALVFRITGAINLAQGAFVVLGALAMYTFETTLLWPVLVAALAAIAVATLVGAVTGALVFAPAVRRLPASGMVMLTGGLLTLFEGAMLLAWGSQPYQLQPFSGYRPVQIAGIHVPTQGFWDIGISTTIIVALWYTMQRTTLGRALRACAENPAAASLVGIDVEKTRIASFTVAAALGAMSGIIIGPIVSLQFDAGRLFTISGFIAVVAGGIGSFFGAVVGGLGLGLAEQFAAGYISSIFSTTVALLVLLAVLVWRPTGLLSSAASRGREDVREAVSVIGTTERLDPSVARMLSLGAVGALVILPVLSAGHGFMSSLVIAGILFLAVLGLDVLMGYCGQVSLGHAAFLAIGGYTAAIITTRFGVPPALGVASGLIVSLTCAAVLSSVTVRLRGHFMALATLAFGLLVDSLAVGLSPLTGGPSGLTGIPHFSLGAFVFSSQIANYALVWGLVVVSAIVLASLLRTDFGRVLRAIRTDQTAARALGIDVPRYKLYAFLISAGFASVAGSLYAFYFQYLSPELVGTSLSLDMVTMLIIGGEGSLVGPVIGVALLTLFPTIFQPLANAKTLVSGGILVLALLYLPSGLFGAFVGLLPKRVRAPSFANAVELGFADGDGVPKPPAHALELRSVSKAFGGVHAVENISLHVEAGVLTALIGPNGAGKSTLFNLLTNLYSLDSGQTFLFGEPLAGKTSDEIARMGLIRTFQTARVFAGMTVLENVMVGAHVDADAGERAIEKRAAAALGLVRLEMDADAAGVTLALGAQKMIEVMRALMAQPRVLLLDEPAAGLNERETEELAQLLVAIRDAGTTIVVVEHNMSLVMGIADTVFVLDAGRLIARGTPREIQSNPDVIAAYVGYGANVAGTA